MTLIAALLFPIALVMGVPVAFAMGLAGAVWILFVDNLEASILARRMYGELSAFPYVSIPLFCMIGILAERSGLLPELVRWLQMLLGRVKGGMAYLNIAASMVMGGVSGTAVSDVAALGRIEIQLMTRAGYPAPYAGALTAATAVIAPIFPPSVAMIIYALSSGGVSIGGLFLAGIVPGLLVALGFCFLVWLGAPDQVVVMDERPTSRELLLQTMKIVPLILVPVVIVGGIVTGIFTVTESAAIGVIATLVIGVAASRRFSFRDISDAILYSAVISGVAGMLLGTGALIAWIMTRNQVTQQVAEYLIAFTSDPMMFMFLVVVALMVLGTVLEPTPMIIALAPLLVPVARQYGIDDLQFGMVFIISCLVGMISPPVGILLFIVSSVGEISLEKLYKAVIPFVMVPLVVIGLLILFSPLSTWVPSLFGFGNMACARC